MGKTRSVEEAIFPITSGSTIMVGGFGLVGAPLTLIEALTIHNADMLTIISNNLGEEGKGLGELLRQGKIKKAIGSYFTSNREVAEMYHAGKIEVQLLPQGTFSESIRAGGAGIGGYYTPTSVSTELAIGKEIREIDGNLFCFEPALKADIALIKAHKADELGNLTYYKTARNFNPVMATAANYVIAEVDEIVEVGMLNPEEVVTPHLYVDALVYSQKILTKEGVITI
ncbi:succinyl-CoA:3-ketoacid-CoA transferase [Bacillus sp. SA1-12]|uniref:CoA transferase subunit A n=1 Tax=Bacillus sp. SA1-12 TaxID=1455638 RepID=UPI0006271264|nr:3-oxoacid CoA-transferase subunit A [Bacillus sp. SA1-12]KKI90427.1 succinyl-CoA:3-ketoacid-CoA transferase [Bacillus sp. SA1-12]